MLKGSELVFLSNMVKENEFIIGNLIQDLLP